jgi:hypothetical protein
MLIVICLYNSQSAQTCLSLTDVKVHVPILFIWTQTSLQLARTTRLAVQMLSKMNYLLAACISLSLASFAAAESKFSL